jgi:hypothetical protein
MPPVVPPQQPATPQQTAEAEALQRAKLKGFLDRVVLRVFSASPAAAAYMLGSTCQLPDVIELAFHGMPPEVLPQLKSVIGCRNVELRKFNQDGQNCVGFRCRPTPEELSNLDVLPNKVG